MTLSARLAVILCTCALSACAVKPTTQPNTYHKKPLSILLNKSVSHDNHHENGAKAHDHHHHWNYDNHDEWGDVEVNKLCKIGQSQSPINIHQVTRSKTDQFDLKPNYQSQDFSVKNNGHTIVFNAKDTKKSTLSVNGVNYELLQFHYHVPSEHTVMNAHYPLELHFVHKNDNNELAVVGVMVDRGKQNNDLAKILTNLPVLGAPDSTLGNFNVQSLIPSGATYAYDGSLTTPPCAERVQWLLKAEPIYASHNQLSVLSKLYDGNNRPVQPQGDRVITLVE